MNIELMPHDHGNVQRAAALHKQLRRGGSFDTVAEIFRLLDDGSRVRIFPEIGEGAYSAAGYTSEQVETVRRMHDELLQHPEQRPTIEELSHRCLMNPTTLKAVFKAVYGDSLAAHMKEHRLERAAELLRHGDGSVAEIAAAVGYDSASRFSAAFRERFHMLPTEYRKQLK